MKNEALHDTDKISYSYVHKLLFVNKSFNSKKLLQKDGGFWTLDSVRNIV